MPNFGSFTYRTNLTGNSNVTTSNNSHRNARTVISMAVALAVATFLIYLPVRQFDFLNWDDQSYVLENDHVKGGLTWEGTVWAFTQSHSANWHPLTWLSQVWTAKSTA